MTLLWTNAQAFHLGAMGGLQWYGYSEKSANSVPIDHNSKAAFSYGALAGIDLLPFVGMEIGLISNRNRFERKQTGGLEKLSTTSFEVPLLLQVSPFDWVTFGAGPYFEHFQELDRDFAGGKSDVAWSAFQPNTGTGGLKASTVGMKFHVRLSRGILPTVRAFMDLAYKQGLTDRNQNDSEKWTDKTYQFFLGVQFNAF